MAKYLVLIVGWVVLAVGAHAAGPLFVYQGDGLTVRVLRISEADATTSGELELGGTVYPFAGQLSVEGGAEVVQGSFRAGNASHQFRTVQRRGDDVLVLSTGGARYRLREVAAGGAVKPGPAGAAPAGGQTAPAREPAAPPAGERPAAAPAAGVPDTYTFTMAEFRDINMNNVVAFTMLVPEGFEASGHVEWSQDRTPYPQKKIKLVAADKSQISFAPAATFSYMEMPGGPALGLPGRQGDPPPADLGAWVVDRVRQFNKAVDNVRLAADDRDADAERAWADAARATGQPAAGQTSIHRVRFTYDMGGVPFTEEVNLTYSRLPPSVTQNMTVWNWMLFTNSQLRAPTARWRQLRPALYASVASLRTVPNWHARSQEILMEVTRRNHIIGMDEIRRRGQLYDQLSDQQMSAWRKEQEIGDKKQDARINQIYEVGNFAGPDGTVRKLPNGFKHYYSDGKGGFRMTNNSEPPGGGWTPVKPMD